MPKRIGPFRSLPLLKYHLFLQYRLCRFTWLLLLNLILLLTTSSVAWAASSRPNILFIYTDDHSYRTVSCYEEAESWARTPNIDRLAARGVRFTHAYIGTWCMPSRVTMLTGLHPYGAQTMRMEGPYPGSEYDPSRCPFWPAVFRQQGYHTAQIGKWHSGRDSGFGRDWDHQIVWNRPKYPENAPNYYDNQLLEIDGAPPRMVAGYSTDNYTRWAVDYIRGEHREPGKPWYLWLCYGGVHAPYTPAERHRQDYPDVSVATPADIYPPRPGKPRYMQVPGAWAKGPQGLPVLRDEAMGSEVGDNPARDQGRSLSDWSRQYHQAVRAIDEGVGQILNVLAETGQLQNTLVVFTADQGYAWGQHGFRAKLAPYDANLRAPLIISMPGTVPEGRVCRHAVGGVDLPPTFFRFAGLALPWTMHGHDLSPLLMNPSADWPHPTMITFTADKFGADCDRVPAPPGNYHKSGIPWYVMLVQNRFKYIRTLEANEPEELYDLTADPDELTNLAGRASHAETLKNLRSATLSELHRTNAKMAPTLPGSR
jgi:arylsulfatase A-like enzyme